MRNCVSYRLPCGVRRAPISTAPYLRLSTLTTDALLFTIEDHELRLLLIRREVVEIITEFACQMAQRRGPAGNIIEFPLEPQRYDQF